MTSQELKDITDVIHEHIARGHGTMEQKIAALEGRLGQISVRSNIPGTKEPLAEILAGTKELVNRPKDLREGERVHIPIAVKDIVGISRTVPATFPTLVGGPQVQLGLLQEIPRIPTTSGSVNVVLEESFTNNAAPVAEAQPKPKSDKALEVDNILIEVIAHYFKVSKQCWDDLSGLSGLLSSNLLYGLNHKLDQQVMKGTGTAPELNGLYPQAPAAAAAPGTPTMIDKIALAAGEISAAGYSPSVAVLSPVDYTLMSLLKDTQGNYIYGSAQQLLPRIVTSPSLAAGEWLVGDFSQTALFVREEANVTIGNVNDDFIRNMLTVLGEMRVGLALFHAAALRKNPGA
jgi:HK97 family phage major capsid protein